MKTFFYLSTIIFISMVGCTSTSSIKNLLKNKGYVAVPLKRNAVGHFELKAKINRVVGRFTLDTGATATVVDIGKKTKFKLSNPGREVETGGLGTAKSQSRAFHQNRVKIGGWVRKSLPVFTTDLSHVNQLLTEQGVQTQDGIIGADILRQARAIIDYSSSTLFLKR